MFFSHYSCKYETFHGVFALFAFLLSPFFHCFPSLQKSLSLPQSPFFLVQSPFYLPFYCLSPAHSVSTPLRWQHQYEACTFSAVCLV